jgi:hypothetical protein
VPAGLLLGREDPCISRWGLTAPASAGRSSSSRALCQANVDFDDLADQINQEVELALDADNGLGGLVKYVEPKEVKTSFWAMARRSWP